LEFGALQDIANLLASELSSLLVEGVTLKSSRAVCYLIKALNTLQSTKIFHIEDTRTLEPVIHQAYYNGNVKVVKALLKARFPTNILLRPGDSGPTDESRELSTPMLAALGSLAEGSKEVVQLLRDWGAPSVDILTTPLAELFKTGRLPKIPAQFISHRP